MLTKRTNLLLSEPDYYLLAHLASQTGKTMGELIRLAVRQTYQDKKHMASRRQILQNIDRLTKGLKLGPINYRKLIEDGRKY